MTSSGPRKLVLLFASAACALLFGSVAFAAWPDGYAHRVANMNALYWDLGYPGVGPDAARSKRMYSRSCGIKKGNACNYKSWQGDNGGDMAKAAAYYLEWQARGLRRARLHLRVCCLLPHGVELPAVACG